MMGTDCGGRACQAAAPSQGSYTCHTWSKAVRWCAKTVWAITLPATTGPEAKQQQE